MRRSLALGALLAAIGLAAAAAGGAMLALNGPGGEGAHLVQAAATMFGGLLVVLMAWRWLDARVALAVDRMAAELRARSHAGVGRPLDPDAARALGDLGPAVAALTRELIHERSDRAERLRAATEALEAERANLAEILSEIPVAILVVDERDRLRLYDRQSVHALGGTATLALGRSILDYLEEAPLRAALDRLDARPQAHFLDADLPRADGSGPVRARVRRLGGRRGFALTIEISDAVTAERPLVFDFSALPTGEGALADTRLSDLTFVVFDTETTGLDPAADALVQIAAVRAMKGRCIPGETFETLVDPGRPIPRLAARVHGITDEAVRGAPGPIPAIAAFHAFARGAVLVAHNAPFDLAFLRRQGEGIRFDHPVLDTVLLSAAVFGGGVSHTLDAIAERLDVELPAALRHTAPGDARATAEVLFRLIGILEARGVATFGDAVAAMRRHERLLRDPNRDG